VAQKIAWERDFRRRVAASAAAADYADVWDIMAGLQERKLDLNPLVNLTNAALLGAPHLAIGAQLAGWLRAAAMPEAERRRRSRGRASADAHALLQPTPIPEAQALPCSPCSSAWREWMPPGHPLLALLPRARRDE
jgi:hypothetical protein